MVTILVPDLTRPQAPFSSQLSVPSSLVPSSLSWRSSRVTLSLIGLYFQFSSKLHCSQNVLIKVKVSVFLFLRKMSWTLKLALLASVAYAQDEDSSTAVCFKLLTFNIYHMRYNSEYLQFRNKTKLNLR